MGRGHIEGRESPVIHGQPSSAVQTTSRLALSQLQIGYRINGLMDGGGIWRSSLQFFGRKQLRIIQLGLPSGSRILPFLADYCPFFLTSQLER